MAKKEHQTIQCKLVEEIPEVQQPIWLPVPYPFLATSGPSADNADTLFCNKGEQLFSSHCTSLFPVISAQNEPIKRDHDPIPDRFVCQFYDTACLMVLAGGCNHADHLLLGFLETFNRVLPAITNCRDVARLLQQSLHSADSVFRARTKAAKYSLTSVFVVKLQNSSHWAVLGCSLSEDKIIALRVAENVCEDITRDSYLPKMEATPESLPVEEEIFRSDKMFLYFTLIKEGDYVALLSKGAHANFHPFHADGKEASRKTADKKITSLLYSQCIEEASKIHPDASLSDCAPTHIVSAIANHSHSATDSLRAHMLTQRLSFDEVDKSVFPAFIGSCTVLAMKAHATTSISFHQAQAQDLSMIPGNKKPLFYWRGFYSSSTYSLWDALCQKSPLLETIVGREEEVQFSRTYVQLESQRNFELVYLQPHLTLYYRLPSSDAESSPAVWNTIGSIDLTKVASKTAMQSGFGSLLLQSEVCEEDRESFAIALKNLDVEKKSTQIGGKEKSISFIRLGEAAGILTGNMNINESEFQTYPPSKDKQKMKLVEISGSKPEMVQAFGKVVQDSCPGIQIHHGSIASYLHNLAVPH